MNFKNWLLSEMPMTRFDLKGDWSPDSKKYGYNNQDIGILTNPRGVEKIKQAWSNTKQDYEVYFLRSSLGYKQIKVGEVSPDFVKENLNLDIQPKEGAITVIFTNNRGAEKIPMTAWMIAHRLGHAIRRDNTFDKYFIDEVVKDFKRLLYNIYNIRSDDDPRKNYEKESTLSEKLLRAFALAVGTMNSARNRKLFNFYEFPYELLAQYLITGNIKFNPIPRSLIMNNRMAWGRPNPDRQYGKLSQDEITEWDGQLEGYASKYEHYLDTVLMGLEGKIFVM